MITYVNVKDARYTTFFADKTVVLFYFKYCSYYEYYNLVSFHSYMQEVDSEFCLINQIKCNILQSWSSIQILKDMTFKKLEIYNVSICYVYYMDFHTTVNKLSYT